MQFPQKDRKVSSCLITVVQIVSSKGKNGPIIPVQPQMVYIENKALTSKYELVWSGIVYRGKKKHFLTDVLHVYGDKELTKILPNKLILSHRTNLREALSPSRKRLAVMVFTPSNSVGMAEFMDCLKEFQDCDIIGITYQVNRTILYLIPYMERLKEFVPELDPRTFVGIVVERGEFEVEEAVQLTTDKDDVVSEITIDDKAEKVVKRHQESLKEDKYESDSEDNYSDSVNEESPEGSDFEDAPDESPREI